MDVDDDASVKAGVDLIFLVAPNTPSERLKKIERETGGFLYLVARTGVTGAQSDVLQSTRDLIARVPGDKPKAVGFGISTAAQAAEVLPALRGPAGPLVLRGLPEPQT